MTTAALPETSTPALGGKAHFFLRRLHSLAGVLFGGYIVVHLLINATLVEQTRHDGQATVFQQQVDKIHSLPFLEVVEISMIMLPLAFHTAYGIFITFQGRANVASYGYGKNWLYVAQRWSAMIIFVFALFHVLSFKGFLPGDFGNRLTFVPVDHATQSTINHMHAAWWVGWVIYPIGVIAATFHLANGFWTGAISWGLTISRQAQQRFGYACVGLFVLTTVCGLTALTSTLIAKPNYTGPAWAAQQGQEERLGKSETGLPTAPTPLPATGERR